MSGETKWVVSATDKCIPGHLCEKSDESANAPI
jgi:hypothetical protein